MSKVEAKAAIWDGKSERSETAAGGTYFYQLQASDTLDAQANGTEVGENRNLVPGCKQGVGGRLTGNLVGTAWQVAGPSLIQT